MLGPIFSRELATVPRRPSHYATRGALLGLVGVLGATAWQATVGFTKDATLGETARFGVVLFQIVAYVELVFLVFFAALSAASAVSQEKDRRTFVLLLITDMRDREIVLGKLLGSLLPIAVLLLVSVPVLMMFLLLGGVGPDQVLQAVCVLASAGFAAGSVGGVVALWRERTFQALALSVLMLALGLALARASAALGNAFAPGLLDWNGLLARVDPFAAMRAVLDPAPAGDAGLPAAYGFSLVMLALGALLNAFALYKLRAWNPSGEPVMQREKVAADPEADMTPEQLRAFRAQAHAAPGVARPVWRNPILWREIRTLAYGRRPLLIKLAYGVVLALIVLFAAEALNAPGGRPAFAAAYGLVPVAVLSFLLVSAQAVTSVTSERDTGALDVLLVTDVSPREFVFGKALGVIYNTKEYLVPPLLMVAWYALAGQFTRPDPDAGALANLSTNAAPSLAVATAMVVLFAFVLVLGLHVALRLVNSRLAVVNTLGTVFFISVGTLICIYLIVINGGSFGSQWLSFIAFIALGVGGLWWVLSADRPSPALSLGSFLCPVAMFYCVVNVMIARPGTEESADPLVPLLTLVAAFGFTIAAMLVPLLSEFDVALGRTTAAYEE